MSEPRSESENPVIAAPTPKPGRPHTNQDWWPNQLDLSVLDQHGPRPTPLGADFDYAEEFATVDVDALKRDVFDVMTTSQDWWPADYGHYGPLFIRMSWHAAGTYRIADGRGGGGSGAQRFAPLNSWPDNANLDKARRLLWPVKQKYGRKVSWADLIVFAGNCALESMGFTTFGFGFGRPDVWEPDEVFWGPEDTWLGDERYSGERDLAAPFGAVQMGLIYVNPEGPNANADPVSAAVDIRETFARMAMDDEETVALIVGGHTFGKCHGAVDPDSVGPEPEACPIEAQGIGWKVTAGTGMGADTITSGLEGAWTNEPTTWDNGYLDNLLNYDYEKTTSPAGAQQYTPKNPEAQDTVPDAHDPSKRHAPMMLTTDLALKVDPIYAPIMQALPRASGPARRRVRQGVVQAAAPRHGTALALPRAVGPGAAAVAGPGPRGRLTRRSGRTTSPPSSASCSSRGSPSPSSCPPRGRRRPASAAPTSVVARTGRASASRRRRTGRSTTRASWPRSCRPSRGSSRTSTPRPAATKVSLADLIVLGGCAAVEQAAKNAGHDVTVPFAPGRTDASQEQTDVDSFAVLEPTADGFRNYLRAGEKLPPETLLLDRANLLTLTAARDDGARRRDAGVEHQLRAHRARRVHRPARDADQRLLRATCSTWARSGRHPRRRRTCTRVAIVRRARSSGPPPPSTSSSGRTPSSGPSRRSTRRTTRRRCSCATSWPRGTRS